MEVKSIHRLILWTCNQQQGILAFLHICLRPCGLSHLASCIYSTYHMFPRLLVGGIRVHRYILA